MKNTLRRSIGFSVLDKYLSQILIVVTTAVMSRILTPAEIGLFVIGQSVILLAENFRDFGINSYIVQVAKVDRLTIRSAFTLTMMLSLAMAALIFGAANEIAAFYDAPDLQHLLLIACIGFFVAPFGSSTIALLRRDMAFQTLAAINVAVAVVNMIVTVSLGLLGFGSISYIWAYVISNAVLVVLALVVKPDFWIFVPAFHKFRTILNFGLTSAAVTVANMAYDLLPRLWFGKVLGFDAVGAFSRAVTICQLPDRLIASGLQPVLLPAMAAKFREGGNLKEVYLRGHQIMSTFQWPALLMLAILAEPVVAILLGAQWVTETPPLVRIMAIATMAMAPSFMTFPVLVAAGRIRDALINTVISLPPSAAILLVAAPYGLGPVAVSFLFIMPFQMLMALVFIRRAIGFSWAELIATSRASFIVTLCTGVVPVLTAAFNPTGLHFGWAETVIAVLGGAAGWAMGIWLSGHPLASEAQRLFGGVLRSGTALTKDNQ